MKTSRAAADVVLNREIYATQTDMNGINGPVYFHAHRSGVIRYSGDQYFVLDTQMYEERLTGVGSWIRRWLHWGGRDAIDSFTVGTLVDSTYGRYVKERVYEARLSNFLDTSCDGEVDTSKLSPRLVCSDPPSWTHFPIGIFEL